MNDVIYIFYSHGPYRISSQKAVAKSKYALLRKLSAPSAQYTKGVYCSVWRALTGQELLPRQRSGS